MKKKFAVLTALLMMIGISAWAADVKPYAVYNGGTLTFYCDDQRSSREGTTYDLNEKWYSPDWLEHKEDITKVVFNNSFTDARPTTTTGWFFECKSITEIQGINNLNTSEVTRMDSMFDHCSSLTCLDISKFDTKNVRYMNYMFSGCSGLTSLDVSKFDTHNVTNMAGMFSGCSGLTSLDVSNFNTSNVIYIGGMFGSCSGLTNLDVSNFNTSNVTSMWSMFYGCSGLTSLDVSNFNTSNVSRMESMFFSCSKLTSLDVGNFDTHNVTRMDAMFNGCSGLTSLDVSKFDTKNVTKMGHLFYNCEELTNLTMGSQFTTNETTEIDNMLTGCSNLSKVTFNGDVPASIKSNFFSGVGKSTAPATLEVPEQYKANYQAKFTDGKFFGGYLTLGTIKDGDTFTVKTKEGTDMTFKIISTEDKTCQVGNGEEASINVATPGQVTIPSVANGYDVIAIGDKGFYNCSELTHIWLHEGIKSIGELAFYGCTNLRVLDIPHSITTIADNAFNECPNVTISVPVDKVDVLPLNSIGKDITIEVKEPEPSTKYEIERIFIPKPVQSIGERAFSNCSSVKIMEVDEENAVYDSRNACNAIIRTADNTLLYGCQNTVIPATVTAIAQYAFEGHSKLKQISIPVSVSSIGESAFSGCTGLESVTTMIAKPFAINDNTFDEDTYKTATLYVPYGTKTTYKNTDGWKNFFNITELPASESDEIISFVCPVAEAICVENWDTNGDGKLSKGEAAAVKTINSEFENKDITSLDELQYFTGITEIKAFTFSDCSKLTRITLPNGVTNIGQNAFVGNVKLEHITFPDNEGFQLGIHPFQRCLSLTTVTLPKNLTWMMGNPFIQCHKLTEINVDADNKNLESIDGVVYAAGPTLAAYPNGKDLEEYTIADGTVSILINAFSYSNKLKKVNMPASITTIGGSAFNNCSNLTSIELPADLEVIGAEAFNYTNLTTVISNDETPFEITEKTFSTDTYNSATLFVPAGSKALYQADAAGGWKKFKNIVEMPEKKGDVNGDDFVDEDDITELAEDIMDSSQEYDATKDVNHDGVVDVADIVEETNIIKETRDKSKTGTVEQANSMVKAQLTSCIRGGGKLAVPDTYVFIVFTLKNVSTEDFSELRIGHTAYYQNMEGTTDTGDEIHNLNVSITDGDGSKYYPEVRFPFQAGETKTMMIMMKKVPTTAKSLTLQVGLHCDTWEKMDEVVKFIDVPITR
jgi:surface protein